MIPTTPAIGDFNGDGVKDVIVSNSFSGSVTIWHGSTKKNDPLMMREDFATGFLSDFVVAADFTDKNPTGIPQDVGVAVFGNNDVAILDGI